MIFGIKIKRIVGSDLSLFVCANALYSLSTGLINLLSPFILERNTYEEFIYIFQIVLFLTGISTAGIVPALLRYYKLDVDKYKSYYIYVVLFVFFVLVGLSIFRNNPLSEVLKINPDTLGENLIIYCSIIFSLLFIFNRGLMTAQNRYRFMVYSITLIFFIRIVMLLSIYHLQITSPYVILILTCIVPFIGEAIVFFREVFSCKRISLDGFWSFLSFAFKVYIIGVIFSSTSRQFLVATKGFDDTLAAALSFSIGLIGIIHILNTSLTSYFIGKLDARDMNSINNYIKKIKRYFPLFICFTVLLVVTIYTIVYFYYPTEPKQAAIIASITMAQTSLMSYIGLITLLAKTFNKLNLQLIINVVCFCVIYVFIEYFFLCLDIYIAYLIVSIFILMSESILAYMIMRNISKINMEYDM